MKATKRKKKKSSNQVDISTSKLSILCESSNSEHPSWKISTHILVLRCNIHFIRNNRIISAQSKNCNMIQNGIRWLSKYCWMIQGNRSNEVNCKKDTQFATRNCPLEAGKIPLIVLEGDCMGCFALQFPMPVEDGVVHLTPPTNETVFEQGLIQQKVKKQSTKMRAWW